MRIEVADDSFAKLCEYGNRDLLLLIFKHTRMCVSTSVGLLSKQKEREREIVTTQIIMCTTIIDYLVPAQTKLLNSRGINMP